MIFVFLCLTCEGNSFSCPISASKRVMALSLEESLTVRQRMRILCLSWETACLSHLGLCGPGTAWYSTISHCEQAASGWSFLLFVSWCSWIAVFGNWEGFATCQPRWLSAWWKSLSWSLGCVLRVPGPNCTVWSGGRLPSPLPRKESDTTCTIAFPGTSWDNTSESHFRKGFVWFIYHVDLLSS